MRTEFEPAVKRENPYKRAKSRENSLLLTFLPFTNRYRQAILGPIDCSKPGRCARTTLRAKSREAASPALLIPHGPPKAAQEVT